MSCNMPKLISVEGDGHCCHRPSPNWETNLTCSPRVSLSLPVSFLYLPLSLPQSLPLSPPPFLHCIVFIHIYSAVADPGFWIRGVKLRISDQSRQSFVTLQ